MSRRSHITRNPPTPTTTRARPPLDHLIYCDTTPDGAADADVMSIPLTVPANYERVYLAATLWGLQAGGWTLTFSATDIPYQWSEEYVLDAEATLTGINLDAELDERERALVSIWVTPPDEDPDYDRHHSAGRWGFTYWSTIIRSGVGTTPRLPADPFYKALTDRALVQNLYGSVHRDHTNLGPWYPYSADFPYGDSSSTDLETYELFPTYQHFDEADQPNPFLPVTLPAGTTIGAWFEPDLIGDDSGTLWMDYDPGTSTGTLMPLVPFTGTVTYHFDGGHDNVLIEDDL